jgi:hypothetical protein
MTEKQKDKKIMNLKLKGKLMTPPHEGWHSAGTNPAHQFCLKVIVDGMIFPEPLTAYGRVKLNRREYTINPPWICADDATAECELTEITTPAVFVDPAQPIKPQALDAKSKGCQFAFQERQADGTLKPILFI